MTKVVKAGLSHALDTAGKSREHNIHLAKFWRLALSNLPGVVCIAPWIDIAEADKKPVNRKTQKGKALLSKFLEVDALINNLMDILVVIIPMEGGLSEGQIFECESAKENNIPILTVSEHEIGDAILDPEGFAEEIIDWIKESKKRS